MLFQKLLTTDLALRRAIGMFAELVPGLMAHIPSLVFSHETSVSGLANSTTRLLGCLLPNLIPHTFSESRRTCVAGWVVMYPDAQVADEVSVEPGD